MDRINRLPTEILPGSVYLPKIMIFFIDINDIVDKLYDIVKHLRDNIFIILYIRTKKKENNDTST